MIAVGLISMSLAICFTLVAEITRFGVEEDLKCCVFKVWAFLNVLKYHSLDYSA